MVPMKRALLVVAFLLGTPVASHAANLAKTYSYFSIGGTTLDEIERELDRRGPKVQSTGQRHPGATQMSFTTKITYAESKNRCVITAAVVTVKAKVILPQWRRSRKAAQDVRLIWDTLSSDIRRHEESHVVIAKNHARDLEKALMALGNQENCQVAAAKAKATTGKVLAKHDRAQEEFDRVEGLNFESRMMRLLRYRLERIEDGRLPG
jgi:predicted secreted Zn-dependent protease